MRKMLLSALVAMTAAMTAAADYPTLYLRGAMTNDGWGANESLRFQQ